MRILVIEDNPDIAANIGDYLEIKGNTVDFAANGVLGLKLATEEAFDVIVLDINLPKLDGFSVCKELRDTYGIQTPLLMLTARDSLADKIKGFSVGAWDYLVKPFALEELEVRLTALATQLSRSTTTRALTVGDLKLDISNFEATRAEQRLELHNACLKILELLMRNSPNIVHRRDIEYLLWGDELPDSSPLRSHMYELRNVIDKPFEFSMLRTVRGVGFKLVAEEKSVD